jgi:hypothetical protein
MTYREHPAEQAQPRTMTPALIRTSALNGAHTLDEPADDREQHVQATRR